MSMSLPPSSNFPSPFQVADGATPSFVFTLNGSSIESVTMNGQQLQLTNNQNGTISCILPPVHQNVTLVVNYLLV